MLSTIETGDHHVRFPSGLNSNVTVHTRQDKALATSANLPPILPRQSHPGPHGDLPSDLYITLCQLRVFANGFSGEAEEDVNTIQGNLLRDDHLLKGP